ncbi:MAG: PD40 domain-containing protein [Flavobacteriales bacterium]|nr:PD40 domain-containing protein [Flavobacteriales bacterium]
MNRFTGILFALAVPLLGLAQGGDQQVRAKADGLFAEGRFAEAYPLYSQLVSLDPADRDLNYRFGACTLYGGDDKEKAIGHLKYACEVPATPPLAWFFLGRSYHLAYRFKEALAAYEHYKGTADKKVLLQYPVDVLEQQCRNGQHLLSNLKDIAVRNKLEVDANEFFRFYDLSSIGGRIVVTPDELRTSLDKKSKDRSLIYLPDRGGAIYFSSLGKDGRTGRDIYRSELLPTGQFAEPMKLAGYVNTDQDEDYPFLAPDGKSFYFSSKGHNSMGGYDVFRSSYDKGLDVFGAPENMDFAVNTPDDDIFYLVDPEGKEACFASGRSSHQGMLHVYRVSTTQVPINITVLKGTFASLLDAADRKAHIVVEDALTREKVSDVRTDLNGNYVLSLPRSGRYKFVVEAGPTGRTHVGYVEVPRSDAPRAYRQEMSLVEQAAQEKLMIRNYFEEPLGEDLMALALEEIKRRARLDVTANEVVAQQPAVETPSDVVTAAGFTGDVTKEQAVKLAAADAQELTKKAEALNEMSTEAYSMALDNAVESERLTQQANELVAQAEATTDEARKNELMIEAASKRQRAREANMRAHAAWTAGKDLGAERSTTEQAAATATKLSTELSASVQANNDARTLTSLKELKTRLDVKNGPEGALDATERTRRAAMELDKEAAKAVQQTLAKSEEESELVGRINRLKRDQESTGGKAKKEEIGREITQLQEQLGYLHEEVNTAVARSRAAEKQANVAKGQAQLTRYLVERTDAAPVNTLDQAGLSALEQKIGGNDARIQSIAVDERFDALIATETEEAQRSVFDWQLQDTGAALASDRQITQVAPRDASAGAERMAGTTVSAQSSTTTQGDLRQGVVSDVPVSNDGVNGEQNAAVPTTAQQGAGSIGAETQRPAADQEHQLAGVVTPTVEQTAAQLAVAEGTIDQVSNSPTTNTADRSSGTERPASTTTAVLASTDRPANDQVPARTEEELVSVRGVGQLPGGDSLSGGGEEIAAGTVPDRNFIEVNDLAELKQLRDAERNKVRRDSLDQRIALLEEQIRDERAAEATLAPVMEAPEEEVVGEAKVFVPTIPSTDLANVLFPDFVGDRERIANSTLAPEEKALSLHGLELMLADSAEAETARQLAVIEADPSKADDVLPRVERLRQLKEEHIKEADRILESSQQQYAAQETRAMEQIAQEQVDDKTVADRPATAPISTTSHVDRYVSVQPDEFIYESVVEHRSPKVGEAVQLKDRDLERMVDLGDRIDSMETLLETMPRGKEWDKVRRNADQLIDDEVILRTEMGQRMAYISKEEYKAGQDSLKEVATAVAGKGVAPSEPLVLMSRELEQEAKAHFDKAVELRRTADRSEDIVQRDDLYRKAYQEELEALRGLDKAITVNAFMLSDDHKRGETLSYAEVEQRMFGGEETTEGASQQLAQVPTAPIESNVRTLPMEPEVTTDPGVHTDSSTTATVQQAVRSADQAPADLSLYKQYMTTDQSSMAGGNVTAEDVSALALGTKQAKLESQRLEQRSVEVGDQALATRDSLSTAKKRDRERLTEEAVRLQQLSDSLHQASLAMDQRSLQLELEQRSAAEALAFKERLNKYYYLGNEEQRMVQSETDPSRYFMARTKALEQQQQAAADKVEAQGSHQLADTLLAQATMLLGTPDQPDGRVSEQRIAQAKQLNDRAVELHDRADSLSGAAARLNASADLNDRQAALLLQGMPAERSTEIMALEQRTRRTDAILAESRALIAQVDSIRAKELRERAGTGGTQDMAARTTADQPSATVVQPQVENIADAVQPMERVSPSVPDRALPQGGFRMPEVLSSDIFGFRAADAAPQPILKDQPMPEGVVYKVQIGAFKNDIPEELFRDMLPVMGETTASGVTRYTAGLFTTPEGAERAQKLVRERGYRDAFVVAYDDGRRISMAQARQSSTPLPAGGTVAQAAPVTERPAAVIQAPLTPASAVQPLDDAQVLASYPATAEDLLKQFAPPTDATAYYNDPAAAPARQVETVKGLFFTVQVGVYSKPTALDKLFNITPLNSERTETNKIRYTTGVFLDMDKVRLRKDEAVSLGVKDAFITAYLNGKRIPMRDARALLQKFGPSVLADPTIATH